MSSELTRAQFTTPGAPLHEEARSMYQNVEIQDLNGNKSVARIYVGNNTQQHVIRPATDATAAELAQRAADDNVELITHAEWIAATRTRQYATDADYRNAIIARVLKSGL